MQRFPHIGQRAFILHTTAFCGVVALLLILSLNASAEGVPKHMVPMTVDLLRATRTQLKEGPGDSARQEVSERAYRILRSNGLLNWGRGSNGQNDTAQRIASALGLKEVTAGDAARLQAFLDQAAKAGVGQAVKEFYGASGRPVPDDRQIKEIKTRVEKTLDSAWGKLAREHTLEGREEGQSIQLRWDPENSKFYVHVRDEGGEGREPLMTTIEGNVENRVSEDGKSVSRSVAPVKDPVQPMAAEDLKKHREAAMENIRGEWIDQNGDRWIIAGADKNQADPLRGAVKLIHHFQDGTELAWPGSIGFRRITAERKAEHLLDTKKDLPMDVRKQIIGKWKPKIRLELDLPRDTDAGPTKLQGLNWSWHVTYDGSNYQIKRIHTSYAQPLTLTRPEPEVEEITFVEAEFPCMWLEKMSEGESFRVRVVFRRDPGKDQESVTIRSGTGSREITVQAIRSENPLVFLTGPVRLVPSDESDGKP